MGSFNTSCFATRQTIAPGDACRVAAIVQRSSFEPVQMTHGEQSLSMHGITDSTCYPDAFWRPAMMFIPAVYNDYGRFKLVLNPLSRRVLLDFFAQALTDAPAVQQGANQYHDVPCDIRHKLTTSLPLLAALLKVRPVQEPETEPVFDPNGTAFDAELEEMWDYVFEAASEERLFWSARHGVIRPMQFAVMHQCAYDALASLSDSRKDWDGHSLEPTARITRVFAQAMDEAKEVEKELREASASEDLTEEQMKSRLELTLSWRMTDTLREAFRTAGGSSASLFVSRVLRAAVKKTLDTGSLDDKVLSVLVQCLRDAYLHHGLLEYNLHFEPMVYAGQDYHNEIGESYRDFVVRMSQQVSAGRISHYYGELKAYSGKFPGPEQFKAFIRALSGFDVGVTGVHQVSFDGVLYVSFLCSVASLDELRSTCDEIASGTDSDDEEDGASALTWLVEAKETLVAQPLA